MRDINKVILVGRVGVDPVLRSTQSGTSVANFSIATETFSKDKQESDTTWHKVVVWAKQAEWCHQQVQKGMPLFVEGKIKTKKYEDSEGKTKYMTEVHAEQVLPLHFRMKPEIEPQAEAALN